jgi:hypothetical protein
VKTVRLNELGKVECWVGVHGEREGSASTSMVC